MSNQYEPGRPQPDVAEVLAEISKVVSKNVKRLGPIIGFVIVGLIAATGFYSVKPGEIGVVRTFGKETTQTKPGLHYRIPLVQEKDIVNVEKVRRIEVGYRGTEPHPEESQMLTGDENIIDAQMLVQFRVVEPSKFLFKLAAPEQTLRTTAEVALRSSVGRQEIDKILTTGRALLQTETKKLLQRLMDQYESGVLITEVKLQDAAAPGPVKDAFNEVSRAREKKEQLINEANGYRESKIPKARGKAREIEQAAEAYKQERILRAKGDAARFTALYAEYKQAKQVTRDRMYLETMERIMANLDKKVIIDEKLTKGAVPILPLGNLAGGAVPGVK